MEQEQYIKTCKKGQHLNLERRVRLEYLLKNNKETKAPQWNDSQRT